ncbi:MAG: C45 family peptidase [Spirochaetota bacterium]|nr:C45 family peptidase [Spirochaetota bacterium]
MYRKKSLIKKTKWQKLLFLTCSVFILSIVNCNDEGNRLDPHSSNDDNDIEYEVSLASSIENNLPYEEGMDQDVSLSTPTHFDEGTYGKGKLEAIDEDSNKYILKLRGTPYEMGFQYGYLIGDHALIMAREYPEKILMCNVESFPIEISISLDGDILDVGIAPNIHIKFNCWTILSYHLNSVPAEFLQEIDGIVDGAAAAGHITDTEKSRERFRKDLLFINMGQDIQSTIYYKLKSILQLIYPNQEDKVETIPHSCDGFVALNDATENGNVIMGRDFMFHRDVFYEHGILIEYNPDNGNSYVNVAAAGLVSVVSGMNSKGIAIGAHVTPCRNVNYFTAGMGVSFLKKKVMQEANELSEAIEILKNNKRGVPWIVILADGQGEEQGGAVVEYSANFFKVRHTDYEWNPTYIQRLLGYTDDLQIENNPNVVIAANTFITPEMNIWTRPIYSKKFLWNSRERYKCILDQIFNVNYGLYERINMDNGMNLVNYLHADLENYREGYTDYHILDYVWMPEVLEDDFVFSEGLPVSGSRTIFDLGNLELKTLYGKYGDPWVFYTMPR